MIYLFVTDLKEPWKVIAEPAGFLIAPRGWERVSDVSNVVFTNGAIADDDGKVYIYYAASDTRLHVASTTIGQLLDFAFKNPADPLRSRDCVCNLVRRTEKGRLRRRGWGLRWEKAQKGGKGTNLRGFFED